MNTASSFPTVTILRRARSRAMTLVAASLLAAATAGPAVVAAPVPARDAVVAQQQNVDWMSADTASYLGSIGMDVMVPGWIPSPFTGVAPDVYAGDGSYSLYWMAPGSPPTFLHITGVIGGEFPAGSKADLNVQLSVNADVQGWPAVRDIGIPEGSTTPIYDQVFWIVNGVRYSVESNNIGTDSLTIANGMLFLQAPVYEEPTPPPVYEEPTAEPVYEEPAPPPTDTPVYEEPAAPPTDTPVYDEPVVQGPVSDGSTDQTSSVSTGPVDTSTSSSSTTSGTGDQVSGGNTSSTSSTSTGSTATTTDAAPWSPGKMEGGYPSDGTAGPRPPVIGGDGTGGLFDTSLPRIVRP